jgi:GntR family transcriptional activator of glc operon
MHLLGSQPRTLYDLFEVRGMLETESARLAALRGTAADFLLITRRYDEMVAAHGTETDASTHARLDHAFHLAICEASHNPVLAHTLSALTDPLLSSVFASVNNLYHREVQKKVIDRQHARLYNAVTGKLP